MLAAAEQWQFTEENGTAWMFNLEPEIADQVVSVDIDTMVRARDKMSAHLPFLKAVQASMGALKSDQLLRALGEKAVADLVSGVEDWVLRGHSFKATTYDPC